MIKETKNIRDTAIKISDNMPKIDKKLKKNFLTERTECQDKK